MGGGWGTYLGARTGGSSSPAKGSGEGARVYIFILYRARVKGGHLRRARVKDLGYIYLYYIGARTGGSPAKGSGKGPRVYVFIFRG